MFKRFATGLTAILATSLLVSCAAGEVPAATDQFPDINTVLDESNGVIEEIMVRFPEADQITNAINVYRCDEQGEGIGHWMKAFAFTTTDIPGGVAAVREKFADIESSYGTRKQEVTYADGSTWPVNSHHLLLEDESGSYLLMFDEKESGLVQTRVITPCGELR